MKHTRKILAGLLALMLLASCTAALAEGTGDAVILAVSGQGEVYVPADTAIINLGVRTTAADVQAAQQQTNTAIDGVLQALTGYGIPAEDINTGSIEIWPVYDYSDGTDMITGYSASNTLAIRTADVDKVGEIIDLAFASGANTLNYINFSASDTEEAEDAAMELAVKDAAHKAEILTKAAGLTVSRMVSISEGGVNAWYNGIDQFAKNAVYDMAEETAASEGAGTFAKSAKILVSCSVSVTYEATPAA